MPMPMFERVFENEVAVYNPLALAPYLPPLAIQLPEPVKTGPTCRSAARELMQSGHATTHICSVR